MRPRRCGWVRQLAPIDGTVKRVAGQLGYGTESVRAWVRQGDIDDGGRRGRRLGTVSGSRSSREVRELRRANAILKSASAFFAAELDRPHR